MGNFLCKKKLAAEELESLSMQTRTFREEIEATFQNKKATLRNLTIFIFFLVTCLTSYVIIKFQRGRQIEFTLLIFLGGLLALYFLRKIANFYYSYIVSKKQRYLDNAIEKKRKILEDIKEKETFKVAKELLDKYEETNPTESEHEGPAIPKGPIPKTLAPNMPILIKKIPASISESPGRLMSRTPQPETIDKPPPIIPQRPPIRPLIREGKTLIDKMVDYFFQDGPNNRFALICGACHHHNGMALPGEFEYLAFTCFVCNHFNPARKLHQRLAQRNDPSQHKKKIPKLNPKDVDVLNKPQKNATVEGNLAAIELKHKDSNVMK